MPSPMNNSLNRLLEEQGLTIQELAENTKLSVDEIIQLTSGEGKQEKEKLQSIAGALNVSVQNLLTSSDAENVEVQKKEREVIIVCGPPHSGKSVFFATLKHHLPRRNTRLFRACPDGEGTWSQKSDEGVAQAVRHKGSFSPEFMEFALNGIDNISAKRTLVDVGGIRSKENGDIFRRATHAVVLCRTDKPEEKEAWEQFAKENGLIVMASLDSALEGEQSGYTDEEGTIRGRVVGLERGQEVHSEALELLAERIMEETEEEGEEEVLSEVDGMRFVSFDNLADELQVPSKGKTIKRPDKGYDLNIDLPWWTAQHIRQGVNAVRESDPETPVWLDGGHPAALYAAVTAMMPEKEVWYTDETNFKNGRGKVETLEITESPSETLDWSTEERDDYTLVEVNWKKDVQWNMANFEERLSELKIPNVNPDKGVVISGKMAYVLFGSLTRSYQNHAKWVSIFTPQQKEDAGMQWPAMVVASEDTEHQVGKYVDCPAIENEAKSTEKHSEETESDKDQESWKNHMVYGSERFESATSNNHNIIVFGDTDTATKVVLGDVSHDESGELKVKNADVALVLPKNPDDLKFWEGYPGHQASWQPLWTIILNHTQHRTPEELEYKKKLWSRIQRESAQESSAHNGIHDVRCSLLHQANNFWQNYLQKRIEGVEMKPRKRFKDLTRILQDILLYIESPNGVIEDQEEYLRSHELYPWIVIANKLRDLPESADAHDEAAKNLLEVQLPQLEDAIRQYLEKCHSALGVTDEEARETAGSVQDRIAEASTHQRLLIAPNQDIRSAEAYAELSEHIFPPDLEIANDEHDRDVVTTLPSLSGKRPEFHQLYVVEKGKSPLRTDVIAVPPDLKAWDTVQSELDEQGNEVSKESYQPPSGIIATHTTPLTDTGEKLRERLQQELDPHQFALHYLGAAREFMSGIAWGKSFSQRIDAEHVKQIKKLIPLYRVACDLLPRAVYMLKTGEFPAGVSNEELWNVGGTSEEATQITQLFASQKTREPTQKELNSLAASIENKLTSAINGVKNINVDEVFKANMERMGQDTSVIPESRKSR